MSELLIVLSLGLLSINVAIMFSAFGIGMAINNLAKVIKEKNNE